MKYYDHSQMTPCTSHHAVGRHKFMKFMHVLQLVWIQFFNSCTVQTMAKHAITCFHSPTLFVNIPTLRPTIGSKCAVSCVPSNSVSFRNRHQNAASCGSLISALRFSPRSRPESQGSDCRAKPLQFQWCSGDVSSEPLAGRALLIGRPGASFAHDGARVHGAGGRDAARHSELAGRHRGDARGVRHHLLRTLYVIVSMAID